MVGLITFVSGRRRRFVCNEVLNNVCGWPRQLRRRSAEIRCFSKSSAYELNFRGFLGRGERGVVKYSQKDEILYIVIGPSTFLSKPEKYLLQEFDNHKSVILQMKNRS